MPFLSGIGFQNLISLVSSELESLHDLIMVWLMVIMVLVVFIFVFVMKSGGSLLESESEVLEKTWTLIPMIILISIAIPSIHLLCVQDVLTSPMMSLKLVSNQWNWLSESKESDWDHLLDTDMMGNVGGFDSPKGLPLGLIRIILTSTDVLHSLGLPSMGVKLDSIPGRLNSFSVDTEIPGMLSGSCYELCGNGHSMMPINFILN